MHRLAPLLLLLLSLCAQAQPQGLPGTATPQPYAQPQVRSLPGPYLFGADEDLTPVILSLSDMDGDGQDDLLVNVRNEQIVYLNRDGGFRLPTPEEQQRLVQELGS